MLKNFKDFFAGYSAAGSVEFIVAGLGNPGRQYEGTRHNAGFMAVDHIASKMGFKVNKLKFKALCGDCMMSGKRVLFLKPSTYMNNSGQSVQEALAFYKVPPENLVVISDDIVLEPGAMRVRKKGSDGGQKGLANIIYLTGRDDFPRVRIGIGAKPHPDMELKDWVLSRFTKADLDKLSPVWDNVMKAVELIVSGDAERAMNEFNRRDLGR